MAYGMSDQRISELLEAFRSVRVAVLGDFFLDLYIQLDRGLSELSLETNLEAFQTVDIVGQPGAAGVVTNNLIALGAGASAVAYTGEDGNGYTLRKALSARGVNLEHLIERDDRFTPTYIKPMMREVAGTVVELNRVDVKNRTPNTVDLNRVLAEAVEAVLQDHDGILVVEQVADDGCGTLSPLVRTALAEAGQKYPEKIIAVDSRHFTANYDCVTLKVNFSEVVRAVEMIAPGEIERVEGSKLDTAVRCQRLLHEKTGRPVFVTLGAEGISGIADGKEFYHPAFPISGPVDIVGAGDSVLAACGLAMCAGASPEEAAYIGNLVGSIIIQQIGTTGVATPEKLFERHKVYQQTNL